MLLELLYYDKKKSVVDFLIYRTISLLSKEEKENKSLKRHKIESNLHYRLGTVEYITLEPKIQYTNLVYSVIYDKFEIKSRFEVDKEVSKYEL
jgi:hypothetical protein